LSWFLAAEPRAHKRRYLAAKPVANLASVVNAARARAEYGGIAGEHEEIFFDVADLGARLIEFVAPAPGTRALDVGAGRGAVACAALARDCFVTAIDASPRVVRRLTTDHPEITGRPMDAEDLDFARESFDLVTAGFVMEVLDDPVTVLAEIRRVLVPGGTVALSLETRSVERPGWLREFFAEDVELPDSMTHDQLDDLLNGAGFVRLDRESVEVPLPIADPDALWDWLTPRGLAEVVASLSADRVEEFRQGFLAEAQRRHDDGGIVVDFAATLHRAQTPP
jgi:SAM-dependent methyltransferase